MSRKTFILLIFLAIFWGLGASPVLGYRDGTLIRAEGYEKVYIIEDGLKRWVTSLNVFNGMGYKWSNVRIVTKTMVDSHVSGDDLISSYYYPDGSLIKGDGPEVYLLEAGKKRWIPNPDVFNSKGFQWKNIITVDDYNLRIISQGIDVSSEQENFRPTTRILEGPCKPYQSEIPTIKSTETSFKFSGTNPTGSDKELTFETYVQGLDDRWQSTYSYERKINLGEGSGIFTFYVRAKNRAGYYDKSPIFCKFKTKISSYKDKVSIYSVSGWGNSPEYESITIGAGYYLEGSVNITDWAIRTSKRRFTIPQAIKTIHPESIYNHKDDIYLEANERIIIYGGKSPINETGFGINKCWWHIDNADEYEDCYYEHNQDPDFLTGEYRVYLNRTIEMFENTNEEIILLDKDNLVVDNYEY